MLIQKTIKAKIFALTNTKEKKLNGEYWNFQLALTGDWRAHLYSATKQQAERVSKGILRKGGKQIHEDHPLIIRRDCFRIEKQDSTKLTKWWAKIPVYGGSIWVPIQLPYSQELLLNHDIRETKLIRRGKGWFLHITVQKEASVEIPSDLSRAAVIGVDLGEANPATSVVLVGGSSGSKVIRPKFHATSVRAVRAHYSNLRKQIGRRKVRHGRRLVRRIGNREKRIVDYHLHVASKAIVEQAKQLRENGLKPVIALGDIKHLRRPRIKGEVRCKRNNRKVHTMPSLKAKKYIWYKALWEGIPVVLLNEAYTSVTCHRCGATGNMMKRLFVCPGCGAHLNRDLNAATNIASRLLDYMLRSSGALTHRPTPTLNSVAGQPSEPPTTKVYDGGIPRP